MLTNADGALTISGWSIGPDFKIVSTTCPLPPPAPSVLPAGHSCDFQVSFRPQSVGIKSELLSVFDSVRNSPQKVKLHGVATRH